MSRGIIFAFLAAASWGLVYVLEQKTLEEFSVAKFIVYQSLFMGVIALVALLMFSGNGKLAFSDWKFLIHPTFLILMAATFAAEFMILEAVQGIGASWATIFEISYPLFTAIFAYFILRQPLHLLTLLGAFLIFAGSGIVIYANKIF